MPETAPDKFPAGHHVAPVNVRRLQNRLWAAAKQSKGRAFHALYDRIYRDDILLEAWERVRANRGAAGVDQMTIAAVKAYGAKRLLVELQNSLRAGNYHPAPVRRVEIPKPDGKFRPLGIPTVSDRIAQTVVRAYLEPEVEPIFHPDSYGYRPGRSAHDALATCRERCWKFDWAIDLDLKAFFDSIPWDLMLKAVSRHTDLRWVLLYIERWLKAPLQKEDGTLVQRDRGTPQGSAISPLLANLFLHYAFDAWLSREFPFAKFERYADDAVVHCKTKAQAQHVLKAIAERVAQVGLELHPDKTRIVYCKDSNRTLSHEHEQFTFLGYTFRPRLSKSKHDHHFVNFSPAVSNEAKKAISREIRSWRINRRSDKTVSDLARMFNPILQGWVNYYGRFYKSMLYPPLRHLNDYLVRWAMQKYKRLHRHADRARRWLHAIAKRAPALFAHWRLGLVP